MSALVIVLAVLLLIIAGFLLSSVNVKLLYALKEGRGIFTVYFSILWDLLRYKYETDSEAPREKKQKEKESMGNILEFTKNVIKTFRESKRYLYGLLRSLRIKELDIHVCPATGDAFTTGLLSGFIWTLIGSFDATISNIARVDKRSISVQPVYTGSNTSAEVTCIISLRLVNIIILGYKIKKHILKIIIPGR